MGQRAYLEHVAIKLSNRMLCDLCITELNDDSLARLAMVCLRLEGKDVVDREAHGQFGFDIMHVQANVRLPRQHSNYDLAFIVRVEM